MPRYGALFAPWPWTPDGYTGMTYAERERVDKVRQGLRTVFDEGSAYVVEQAVREGPCQPTACWHDLGHWSRFGGWRRTQSCPAG